MRLFKLFQPLAMIVLITAMSICTPLTSQAGQETNGGLFVEVNGQWVAFDEAVNYLTSRFSGIEQLITSDCFGQGGCPQSNFGLALKDWLNLFEKLNPDIYEKIQKKGSVLEFRYINNTLSYVPDEFPRSEIDFKTYAKAAVYRPGEGLGGVVYVSIPVMNAAGQAASGRLTARQNQGFILFHELLNSVFSDTYNATSISEYGVTVLDAHYSNWTSDERNFFGLLTSEPDP
jgi:hypothetical protein